MKKQKYTKKELKEFEDSLGMLSTFVDEKDSFKVVKENGDTITRDTFWLQELSTINKRRKFLIDQLTTL